MRREWIASDEAAPPSIRRRCELLEVPRSTYYHKGVSETSANLALMKRIDRLHLKYPFYGSRRVAHELDVNRKRAQRLMRVMGLEGQAPGRRTTVPRPGHKIYPYLLRNVEISRPNHVWSTDITYVPLESGFMFLTAVIDWFSRGVLSWRLSNTLEGAFCLEALEAALELGTPEIFNTDQGSQFTSLAFTGRLAEQGIAISMDGRGRALDNVFIERLWRSVKYEELYLRCHETPRDVELGLARYFDFYNHERPHQALDYRTPWSVFQSV